MCPQIKPQSLAFAEVVSYIEEYGQSGGDLNHVVKLSDLRALYCECLQRLYGDTTGHIHSTRLAQKLQQHIPTLEAHNSNSGTVLSYTRKTLVKPCKAPYTVDSDDEVVMLMRVAKLVRKEVLEKHATSIVPYVMNNTTIYLLLYRLWLA